MAARPRLRVHRAAMDDTAQRQLNARMHAVVDAVRPDIPSTTADLADEMIEANESQIALEMLSEVLVERKASVTREVVSEFRSLAAELGLSAEVAGRLHR
jgi:hypothetical protein